jgi:hypothetical protein
MSDTIDGSGNDYGRGAIIIIVMMSMAAPLKQDIDE